MGSVNLSWIVLLNQLQISSNYQVRQRKSSSEDLRQPIRYDTSSKDSINMSQAFLKHYAHPLSDWIQYWPQQSPIILLTSCQGLEVVDRSSNIWKTVQKLPHALHVHIGDHMEVLSNVRMKTVVHRALLKPEEARISIPSIHGFALHEKVTCAKELVDEENPPKYKESSFSDFLEHLTANMDNKHRNFLESLRMYGLQSIIRV